MFNLIDIQKRNDSSVLKFFKTANSAQVYSYADLYRDSTNLSTCLHKLLNSISNDNGKRSLNVAIFLPVHSAAIVPSIVG